MPTDWITPVVGWLCLAFGAWVGYAVGRASGDEDAGGGDCTCHRDDRRGGRP